MTAFEKSIYLINPILRSTPYPIVKKLQEAWLKAEYEMLLTKVPSINWNNPVNIRRCRYKASMGLLSIGSMLKYHGFKVRYVDEQVLLDKCIWRNEINKISTEAGLIGITSMTVNSCHALEIVNKIRSVNKKMPIIMGGCHFSYMPEEALFNGANAVVKGQGEFTMLELTRALFSNNYNWRNVKGLFTLDGNKKLQFTGNRGDEDIFKIPHVDFQLLPKEMKGQCEVYIFSTRGCKNKCSFCAEGHYWSKVQKRPIEVILKEIASHNKEIQGNIVFLNDSTFGSDIFLIHDLCLAIRKRFPDLFFRCMLRANVVTPKLINILRSTNIIDIQIGIESACADILNLLNKKELFSDYICALRLLKKYIPIIRTSWMVGCPGESEESLAESLKQMEYLFRNSLIDEASVRMFVPYPGTPVFNNPSKYGIKLRSIKRWEEYDRRSIFPIVSTKSLKENDLFRWYKIFSERIIQLMRNVSKKR